VVSVPVEITEDKGGETDAKPPSKRLTLDGDVPPADRLLLVEWQESPPVLRFTLMKDRGNWLRSFLPVSLQSDLKTYAATLYRHLTGLTNRLEPARQIHSLVQSLLLGRAEVDRRVKQLGQNLWRDLIPLDLKELYAAERTDWQDQTLLIYSDEPHIPWELAWPFGHGWEDRLPWCGTLRPTRWLRRDAQGNGNDSPPPRLKWESLAIVAPVSTDLPKAQKERRYLEKLATRRGLSDASPGHATWMEVMDRLETGGYDLFHVASHHHFNAGAPDGDSIVCLDEEGALAPNQIVGPKVEGHIRSKRPAFFFNACESGRQAREVTRLAGWASRLVSAGAGLFVGPLWEVTDDGAMVFVVSFYRALARELTVAEAVHCARRHAARRSGDPTWLAYSVYGHPNATVRWPRTRHLQ
jgi:hypothetical protein